MVDASKAPFCRKTGWCVLSLLLFALVVALLIWKPFAQSPAGNPLSQARVAMIREDFPLALELTSRVPEESPDWVEAQFIAGEACTRREDFQGAVKHYTAIPHDDSPMSVQAAFALGEVYRTLGDLTKAEREYEYVLSANPTDEVHERMAFLLAVTRRLWESRPHYMMLVRNGKWTLENLAVLADLERPLEQGEYLMRSARHAPDDLLVQTGLAANALFLEGNSDLARAILQKVVAQSPGLLSAQAMLGECLLTGDEAAFLAWHSRLPPRADEHPDIWYVRGLWARRQHNLKFAARCFWETVRMVPTHRRGNYQLSQVLQLLGDPAAEDFVLLAGRLFELSQHLDDVLRAEGRNEAALKGIVEIMEQTGRYWEGCAWARTAGKYFPEATWARVAFSRMQPLLYEVPSPTLAMKHDLSHYPSTDEALSATVSPVPTPASLSAPPQIRFQQATGMGLDFVYFNGDDPSTPGVRMFEQSGGGVAVLDLDSDGWPDLYFSQGANWIQGERSPRESPQFEDQIYRNMEGERFVNVTHLAGLGDQSFGQGVAVGDVNEDGFPDLYVANVGRNRLYENNGDGTFRDVTQESGLELTDWTSSCVVVDLNADGLPDLFDVNYLTGPDVYAIICQKKGCSPSGFEGLPDRLHINKGDGTFQWVPGATPETNAKGLGVVALDLHERGRPCLFVANDQVPNHFLRNYPSDTPINIRLENQGLLNGLGHNMNGLAMACMGIAVDDVNDDGMLDVFVTNFKTEANTLYLQDVEGLFIDNTNRSGLYAPSLPMTGWGTQFLDADLDGSPDLVVANGHVYPEEETEYRMRPQCFRNQGQGRFTELSPSELGPYFAAKHVGRSLARLDWNRDGLMDCVISNINEPAALLTNATETQGHFLGVKLHATTTARDAIGSVVEVEAGGRRWIKQLIAGDGYQASNERLLHFGLGANDLVTSLKVTWPSGETTVHKNLPADGVLELVEGALGTCRRGQSLAPEP